MNEPFDSDSEPWGSPDPGSFDGSGFPPGPPVHVPWWRHWMPAIVAAAVFAGLVGTVAVTRSESAPTVTTTTSSTLPPGTCPEGAPITCFPLTRVIREGDRGEDVRRIQQRLKDLRFDPGRIDGLYGGDTQMAIWAFQSLVMKMTRDTIVDFVTPVIWDAMRGDVKIEPRRQPGTPNHAEVYIPEQVMAVFKGPELLLVTHVSTGTGKEWCEEVTIDPGEEGNNTKEPIKTGICGEAVTPGGIYYFYNRKYGLRESKLGTLWNPVYFNFGIAVHGALTVPKEPASKGCVRIPIFISQYFPAMVRYNDRVYVWDGKKEPEEYGSQPPPWDRPDPNYTTTTSSTTTTTTLPGQTTVRPRPTTTTTSTAPPPTVAPTMPPGPGTTVPPSGG